MSVEMTKTMNNCNNSNESTAKSDSSESDGDQSEAGEDVTSVVYEIQSESECEEDEPKAVAVNDEVMTLEPPFIY